MCPTDPDMGLIDYNSNNKNYVYLNVIINHQLCQYLIVLQYFS